LIIDVVLICRVESSPSISRQREIEWAAFNLLAEFFPARVCTTAFAPGDDIELVQQPQMSNRKVHERSSFRANFRPAPKAVGVWKRWIKRILGHARFTLRYTYEAAASHFYLVLLSRLHGQFRIDFSSERPSRDASCDFPSDQ